MSSPNPLIFTHPIASLISRSRFTWRPYHNQIFQNFIRDYGLTSSECQESSDYPIDELLVLLELDGYGGQITRMGECVMDLIKEKVRNKLRRVEMKLRISEAKGLDGLRRREGMQEEAGRREDEQAEVGRREDEQAEAGRREDGQAEVGRREDGREEEIEIHQSGDELGYR